MHPRVSRIIAADRYRLDVLFTNGERGVYDCAPLLSIGVFRELRDMGYFQQATVRDGTVVWPHEQDLCPDTIYLDSLKRSAPEDFPEAVPSLNPQHAPRRD